MKHTFKMIELKQFSINGEMLSEIDENQLTDEELSFCNFCSLIFDVCHIVRSMDGNAEYVPLIKMGDENLQTYDLNEMIKDLEFIASKDKWEGKVFFPKRKQRYLSVELGDCYGNVLDFLLLMNGFKRENNYSTVTNRTFGVQDEAGFYKLEATTPVDVNALERSIIQKLEKTSNIQELMTISNAQKMQKAIVNNTQKYEEREM